MNNNHSQVLLIYFNFKGVGQIIRYLLCYLQIPFTDILLDEYEKQRLILSPEILETLRSKSICKSDLPALIHNNEIIYELNQIMLYVCINFNREDLLGVDIYQKARVCEILELYSQRLVANIRFVNAFMEEIHQRALEGFELLDFIEGKFSSFLVESGYVKQLTTYLSEQSQPRFILGNLTIIDFYFIESCKYSLSVFGNIDEKLASKDWAEKALQYRTHKQAKGERVRNVKTLRVMRVYQEFFYSQHFFQHNRAYLQTYGFFPKTISPQHVAVMKKLQAIYFLDMFYKDK